MSSTELQIVSPRADNSYSGKTLAVYDRGPQVTMFRRNPIPMCWNREELPPDFITQDTFARKGLRVWDGECIEVLADDGCTPGALVRHLLARDREFRRLEDKYSYEFDHWRKCEKAEAERKFMEAAREDHIT